MYLFMLGGGQGQVCSEPFTPYEEGLVGFGDSTFSTTDLDALTWEKFTTMCREEYVPPIEVEWFGSRVHGYQTDH